MGSIDRFHLEGERLGAVVGGAVLKHSRDFNLMRECVLGSSLSPHTPAYDLQQACGTGLQSTIAVANGIALGQYESGAAGGVDTTSDAPIAFGDDLRRVLLGLRRAKSNVDRLKLVGKLPAALGVEIPTNGEPRTGLSMGEHAAITAKQMGVKRVDQDELAAASHQNMAAAYDRGFFDDLVTPVPRAVPRQQPARRLVGREAGQAQAGLRREERRRDHDGGQLDAADRRRVGGAAVDRGVGGRAQPAGAGVLRRRRDRRGRLRQRQRRSADGARPTRCRGCWPETA